MTSQQFLVEDNSTVANFKQWGSAPGSFLASAGWVQTSDAGQVNWSTISAVPAAAAYVYEIWKPGDGLTAFYLKLEYGNGTTSANTPMIRFSVGTGTNGSGTLTGTMFPATQLVVGGGIGPGGSTAYECDFSGSNARFGMIMWRTKTGTFDGPLMFAIDRSKDSSGNDTSVHVTFCWGGANGPFGANAQASQGTLFLSQGIVTGAQAPCVLGDTSVTSSTVATNTSMCPVFPNVGYFDFPITMAGSCRSGDCSSGAMLVTSLYGATRTYLCSSNEGLSLFGPGRAANSAFLLRWD